MKTPTKDATRLEDARKWIDKWREQNLDMATSVIIPVEHLNILIPHVEPIISLSPDQGYIRAYFAKNDEDMDCLLLVATIKTIDASTEEVIYEDKWRDCEDGGKSLIYDFTFPCPSTCDPKSPLYDTKKGIGSCTD